MMRTRLVLWVSVVLIASVTGPAVFAGPSPGLANGFAGPAGATDGEIIEWVNELAPVAMGQGALDALGAADWVGAIELAVAQAGAAPLELPRSPSVALPSMELGSPELEAAITDLVNAVMAAQTLVGADSVANAQAALLIAQAIDEALPALETLAGPSTDGGEQELPVDLHALTHELEHINAARSDGRPIFADMEKMVEWNEALQVYYETPGSGPSVEENMALHNSAVQAPFIHALEHAAPSLLAFVEAVNAFSGSSAGPDALGGTCGVIGAPAPITTPGCTVIITPPGAHTYTAPADDAMLIIDLGGFDTYLGQFAGAGAGEVRVAIDVGNEADFYLSTGASALGTQGAGVGGVGVLVNVGGNDGYVAVGSAGAYGQGYSSGGVGALVDLAGHDVYHLLDVAIVFAPPPPTFGGPATNLVLTSRPAQVRGQGAAVGGGVGALLDATGVDSYNALATSQAIFPSFIYGGQLRAGETQVVQAISGAVSATVQGAASGGTLPGPAPAPPAGGLPGVGLQVDASLPTESNTYNAMALSFASGWTHSSAPLGTCIAFFFGFCSAFAPAPARRFCDGTAGAADVRAQGAGFGNLGVAASATAAGLATRYVEAASIAIGECYEVGAGVWNEPMVSTATSGATTALGQGYGTGTGAGALVNGVASSFNRLLSDSVAIGCSQCFGTNKGTCGGTATVGSARASGQGAGSGSLGIGASVSVGPTGSNDYTAGAYESANAWAMTLGSGEFGFQATTYLGGATPPTVRVQGESSGGGIGALVDVGGADAYNTVVPWPLAVFPGQIGGAVPAPLGVERVTQTFIGFGGGTVITPGLDLDKGEREGTTGIALFADIGNSGDLYLENGFPASGAVNGGTWGTTPSAASLGPPPTLEIGIDR